MIRRLLARYACPGILTQLAETETAHERLLGTLMHERADRELAERERARAVRIAGLLADREQAARDELYALRDQIGYGHLEGRQDARLDQRENTWDPASDITTTKEHTTP